MNTYRKWKKRFENKGGQYWVILYLFIPAIVVGIACGFKLISKNTGFLVACIAIGFLGYIEHLQRRILSLYDMIHYLENNTKFIEQKSEKLLKDSNQCLSGIDEEVQKVITEVNDYFERKQ